MGFPAIPNTFFETPEHISLPSCSIYGDLHRHPSDRFSDLKSHWAPNLPSSPMHAYGLEMGGADVFSGFFCIIRLTNGF